MKLIKHLILNIIINGALLYVISQYLPQLQFYVEASSYWVIITFLVLWTIFRFLNTILKKVLNIVTLPLKILTLWLSSIIINIWIFYLFEILVNEADIGMQIQIGTSGVDKLIAISILSIIITVTYFIIKKIFK